MAGITLAKAISAFARELGCGGSDSDRDSLLDEVTKGIEYLLLNGGGEILREWIVVVRNGRFTFPYNLETPVKYKFKRFPNAGYGVFNSAYLSFGSNGLQKGIDYYDWTTKFAVTANKVASTYQPPDQGVRLIATTKDPRDVGKQLMISGKQRGFDIAPITNGYKTAGMVLPIYLENDPEKTYSTYMVDEVTSVVKDETCSYVMLSGIDNIGELYHISYYHPDETVPQYTEGELFMCPPWYAYLFTGLNFRQCDFLLHILGRICPTTRYVRDEEIVPIDSFEMLDLLAKRARYKEAGDFEEMGVIEQMIQRLIKKYVAYQQPPGRQLSFNLKGSAASLTNT